MSYDLSEINRILANMIRIGVVSAYRPADADNAAAIQLNVGGLTTDWLPWGSSRAGKTRQWSAPSVGEQIMLFSPFGDSAQGVAGFSIFSDGNPAPASSPDQDVTTFADGTTFVYDASNNTYTQTVAGSGNWIFNCKVATINGTESVTLNTPLVHATGSIKADGDITDKKSSMQSMRDTYNGHTNPNEGNSSPPQQM